MSTTVFETDGNAAPAAKRFRHERGRPSSVSRAIRKWWCLSSRCLRSVVRFRQSSRRSVWTNAPSPLGNDARERIAKRFTSPLCKRPTPPPSVQADEMCVRLQKRVIVWLAMAMCAKTRLWLGAEVGKKRDTRLLKQLAHRVKTCAANTPLLVVTDGWKAYREAFLKTFRVSERTGKRGQPRRLACPGFVLAQTVKWTEGGRTLGIRVCHLFGASEQVARLLPKEQVLSTAYIERLNATFRQRLAGLHRRTRCLRAKETAFTEAVFLVGTVYNFCCPHRSLSQRRPRCTPAMAAGKTNHEWSVGELLALTIPPPPYITPKRRGRKPKHNAEAVTA